LNVPYDTFITAGGASTPFTWSIISGKLPPGLTFLTTSTSNSAEITGTPTILGPYTFTVQVTDAANAMVTQALGITVYPAPPLSVATPFLQSGTVGIPYSQNLLASSGVQPYTWSIAAGNLPPGLSLANNGNISGTPAASGTFNFTVQVVDSTKPTAQIATANLGITIGAGTTNNGRLSGNYAFSVSGWDPNGFFTAAGSFVADGGGNISSGVLDTNNTVAPQLNQSFTGTYSVGQNGLGTLTFNSTSGSRRFALSMMAGGNANIIEFDDFTGAGTRNSGVLLRQTTGAIAAGVYAFGFSGIDFNKNRFAMAGEFQPDGNGGTTCATNPCLLDANDSGTLSSVAITGGAYSESNGRGTMSLISSLGTFSYNFYVVSANELLVIGIDPFAPAGNPVVSGLMLQQSSGLGTGSLSGYGVFQVTALETGTAIVEDQVGLVDATGPGALTVTSDRNSGGMLSSPSSNTGTYTVDASTGRVVVASNSGFQNSDPVMYLVNTNQAFIIGTDAAVSFGFMTPQSGTLSLSGIYAGGSTAPPHLSVGNVVSIAVAGPSNLGVISDISDTTGLSQVQTAEGIGNVAPNGRVEIMQGANMIRILYLVSPGQFFGLTTLPGVNPRLDIFGQ
jgi:hypothetical protein